MLSSPLAIAEKNAVHRLQLVLDFTDLAPADYSILCHNYRILAICHLLQRADSVRFARNLGRCALARLAMLEREAESPTAASEDICLSRDAGFSAALAIGDFDVASRIADLSPDEPFEDCEYPEDFYFPRYQHLVIQQPEDPVPRSELLDTWEALLDGVVSGQLAVCKGLESGEPAEFVKGLNAFLITRKQELEETRGLLRTDQRDFAALGSLSVEGLGLLRIALSRGFDCADEYPLIPSSAIVDASEFVPVEDWRGID